MLNEVRYQIFVDTDGNCFILDTRKSRGEYGSKRGQVQEFENLLNAISSCVALNGHNTIVLQGDADELIAYLTAG